ncbi:Octicosapeptide/Phox/Bem1p domain-containing protein / tetratricopeptide repeat-containing protein [Melia azedarach]|uniref:Octicosapeptide/Phox/Bem1p domain-containing protein / tetratricopeptide repeat-containing protein n=1 Tax=Melia azedarach TaxID=155640 RepID=A0ACC1XDA5_MELAZ|nr:Octicosapeptide/Phox/Bem1p domain-containing protein / tetratricopeptide repeat-containing protein [Melia azedarach]
MGKNSGKKKQIGGPSGDGSPKQTKAGDNSPKAYDNDTVIFIDMSQEYKEEGNKLFQKRDLEGAMSKYEKALKLLPRNHIDISYLRSNMAACYMQMGLNEYPSAIQECNLALEVTPLYSKALIKRARCYEALNRLDLAFRDVTTVLNKEPNNVMAIEIAERVKKELEERGLRVNDTVIELPPDYVEPPLPSSAPKVVKEKTKKKKNNKVEQKKAENEVDLKNDDEKIEDKKIDGEIEEKKIDGEIEEKKAEDKGVVEETIKEEEPKKTVKLVFGEDIRVAQLPLNCSLLQLREVISDRFPSSRAVLIKYRDEEGDLITITTDEELRWAEASAEIQGSIRLYVVEVNPEQDPFYGRFKNEKAHSYDIEQKTLENGNVGNGEKAEKGSYLDDWIIEFAQLFKNHVGLDSDNYLNLHELGMKVYSEAMEEAVTSEEAQGLFNRAADNFQEMAALALFNWGNVHMSRARKRVCHIETASRESVLEQIKIAYDWAQQEFTRAGNRYEEALKIKPDLFEGFIALGQQQFEQAKLSWYYAVSSNVDINTWPSIEIPQLYNNAEKNMETGMQIWEDFERQRLTELSKQKKVNDLSQKTGLHGLFKDISADETEEQVTNIRSQINLLWGTILYERSIMEFKLGLPVWQECLEAAVEKFALAGASPTDIAVMVKNHCSNNNAVEGFGFKIDEIVQAWYEMYEAKNWQSGVSSFRLEPLLRRRVSKLCHALEHV